MACMSCQGGNQVNSTPIPIVYPTCTVTKSEYVVLLDKVKVQLVGNINLNLYISTIQSQINVYDKACSMFQEYILTNIKPLVV